MRKLFTILILLTAFFACEKNSGFTGNLKFEETIPGGCAIENPEVLEKSLVMQDDEVTYTVTGEDLEIIVGFNATCCGEYSTSSKLEGDTIYISILNSKVGACDCICYYTYSFKYTGIDQNYKYEVNVDNYLLFEGEIAY